MRLGDRHEVLAEELRIEDEQCRGDLQARRPVEERNAAARLERAGRPRTEQVRQKRQSRQERRDADDRVAAGSERFQRVKQRDRPERGERCEVRRKAEQDRAGGDRDTALEAAARGHVAERDQPEADDHADTDGKPADRAQRLVRRRTSTRLLSLRRSKQQDDSGYGREEDELLAERVDAAVVEHDRADHVRRMPLGHDDVVEQVRVGVTVAAEGRKSCKAPGEEGREAERCQEEERDARAARHVSRLLRRRPPSLVRVIATSTTSGYATLLTTSIESATSGACRTMKRATSP